MTSFQPFASAETAAVLLRRCCVRVFSAFGALRAALAVVLLGRCCVRVSLPAFGALRAESAAALLLRGWSLRGGV